MATLADISAKINSLTNTDTTRYPNSDRVIDINMWQEKIVSAILDSQDEVTFDDARFTGYGKVTIPLTTNRDYSIGASQLDSGGLSYNALKIKSLSVSYDGTTYYRATPFDLSETTIADAPASATTQNATIDANFSKTAPRYSFKNGALWLYPLASSSDVSAGGKMVLELERSAAPFTVADLVAGTAIPGFDITFHLMLAYGAAAEYCLGKNLPQEKGILDGLADFEARLRRQYSSKQQDRHLQLQSDYQNMK